MDFSDLIKKSLEYYDSQNDKNKKYIENTKIIFSGEDNQISLIDKDENILLDCNYEILGLFDNQTNVWLWAWLLPFLNSNDTIISRKLLDYALKLEPQSNSYDHYYIKSQLLNSRITIEDSIELDIHLALSSYLIKDLFSFIKPLRINLNKEQTKFNTIYYLIK
jgi:hypothetical protein